VPIVLKSGSLNLLEPSGPVKACNGIALPFCNIYRNSIERGTLSRRHDKIPGERWNVTVITVARLGFSQKY
jgi:hypothetical protein